MCSGSSVDGPGALLLVEFRAARRFILGTSFPFIHALARRLNVPVRWLRFGLDPAVQHRRHERGIGLDAADAARLEAEAADLRPSHVLFSRRPSAALCDGIRRVVPGASLRFLVDGPPRPATLGAGAGGAPLPLFESVADVAAWLGLPAVPTDEHDPAGSLFGSVEPDFAFTPANRAAAEMRPLAFIKAGAECFYRRSAATNPAYEGVDLAGYRAEGCAFCTAGGGEQPWRSAVPAHRRAVRQIAAFFATHPAFPSGLRPWLRISGHEVLLEVVALAESLCEMSVPGADLLLDARPDHILDASPALRAAAERLRGTSHKLHVSLVGVENFSHIELERMNKGVRPWQNLAAFRALRELERDAHETFGFREHGGLSTILFTPWTTLDDLAVNLAVVRHFRLASYCGKLMTSRLRLQEGLAMTALARHDGLVVDAYDDPLLDTARRNFYGDEIPWRFRHPEVEAVNRICTRLEPDDALGGDALYRRVQGRLTRADGSRADPLQAAHALVERAMAAARPTTLDHLLAALPPEVEAKPTEAARWPAANVPRSVARYAALQRAGLSRVNRIEGLTRADVEVAVRLLAGTPAVRVARGAKCVDGDRLWDVFLGRDAVEVEEVLALTERQHAARSAGEFEDAVVRTGRLLGYPECCSRRYARLATSGASNEWLMLLLRCESPGPVPPALGPMGFLLHVPCSLACQRSLALARAIGDAMREGARDQSDVVSARIERPCLLLLDVPGQWVDIVPRGPVGERFDFATGPRAGDDPRLRAIDGGGTMTIDEGRIVVERDGRRVAGFFLTAAVWWHERAFHPEFWRPCAFELVEERPPAPAAAQPAAPSPTPPVDAALTDRVRARLAAGGRGRIAGFTVDSIAAGPDRFVVVALARKRARGQDERLLVHVEPLAGAERFFAAAGDVAVSYSDRTPLRTDAQRRALAAVVRRLTPAVQEAISRRAARSRGA